MCGLALYLGRRKCGLKLKELAEATGGIEYGGMSQGAPHRDWWDLDPGSAERVLSQL